MPRRKKSRGGFRKAARRAYRAAARGYRRARARKRSSFRMGLIGKAGVGLAGGVPIAVAAIDALQPWMDATYAALTLPDKLRISVYAAANTLTLGYGLGAALPTTVAALPVPSSVGSSPGAFIKTTAAGLTMVVIDGVVGLIYRVTSRGKARGRILGKQLISG